MDPWVAALQSGDSAAAWDRFLDQYRRLILAGIRHSTSDADDVMNVFTHVCESLSADDLARLRKYPSDGTARARFSTWLVTVVHHLAADWFRHRDGRRQTRPPPGLSPRQQEIYSLIFLEGHPHREAYQLLRQRSESELSERDFSQDLRVAQRAFNHSRVVSRPRTVSLPVALPDRSLDGEHELQAEEARQRVGDMLATLRDDEQAALRLFVGNGMPAAEVARLVGWPDAKAVYNRVYRLLKLLRRELHAQGIVSGDL